MMEIREITLNEDKAYQLKNESLDVIVSSLGAGIFALRFHDKNMVITPKDYLEYAHSDGYYGKTVGRIAGRIKKGMLSFRGKEYLVSTNENGNMLHGGGDAFSFRRFEGKVVGKELILSLDSKDGDNGFPGDLHLDVIYTLDGDSLVIRYESMSDVDTPVNFTNHSYFCLGDADVTDLTLRLASSRVETYDAELIPLGFEEVRDCLDFRKGKKIGKGIDDPYLHLTRTNGYDHCFHLNERKNDEAPISLEGKEIRLSIETSLPAVQVYSGNFCNSAIIASNDKPFYPHNSVAIEPVYLPLDYESMVSKKEEKKINTIRYTFFKRGN